MILLDSLRQDHVGVYHQGTRVFPEVEPVRTPSLDAFSRDSVVFTNAYPEALPTIPARYVLMTGQCGLPFRTWEPLHRGDITMAHLLRSDGYTCGLISDCYHYRAPGMNYHTGYHTYGWIRGQEYDAWRTGPPRRSVDDYVNANYGPEARGRVAQFLTNTDNFRDEDDWFPVKVVDEAVGWLREHRGEKVFLWIDCFEPHEPWDPPQRFDTYTDPAFKGPRLVLPIGGYAKDWASDEEVREIRGLYAGEVAFVDHCIGRLFKALGELGYLDDSIVVVLADHGHPLGDHGKFLKGADRLYNEMLRVPFIVRLPRGHYGGRTSAALVQFQDLLPTVLDLLGMSNNISAMHGRSFRAVIEQRTEVHREAIITGFHEGIDRAIRNGRWAYVERPKGEHDELYDLRDDPWERRNRIDEAPEEAAALARFFGAYFRRRGSARSTGLQGKFELSSSGLDEPFLRGVRLPGDRTPEKQ